MFKFCYLYLVNRVSVIVAVIIRNKLYPQRVAVNRNCFSGKTVSGILFTVDINIIAVCFNKRFLRKCNGKFHGIRAFICLEFRQVLGIIMRRFGVFILFFGENTQSVNADIELNRLFAKCCGHCFHSRCFCRKIRTNNIIIIIFGIGCYYRGHTVRPYGRQ